MVRLSAFTRPIVWIPFLAIIIVANPATGQTALPPGVDAFIASANALAKAANERVDLGRANARLAQVHAKFTDILLSSDGSKPIQISLDAEEVLCRPRLGNLEVAARRNYIQALAAKIEEIGKPSKIDNISSAARVLFSGQTLDMAIKVDKPDKLKESRDKVYNRCATDLKKFGYAYYGLAGDEPAQAPGVFSAIAALIDAFVSIITPVIVDGAKMIDEGARQKAILAYLTNDANRADIKRTGMLLAQEISEFTYSKRLKLAGAFNEKIVVLRAAGIDLKKSDACSALPIDPKARREAAAKLNDSFVLCWRAAWAQTEPQVAAALKAAEDYDQLADAGDTDNASFAFKPLSDSLDKVGKPNAEMLASLWNWATRLVAFSQKVETAFNKENREKLNKAIDNLVKGD